MKTATTPSVKATATQRWNGRIQLFDFKGTSCENEPERMSWGLVEQRDELAAHPAPAVARAAEGLLLVRPEARLHERQLRARRGGCEREGHDGVEAGDAPRVAELALRLDREHAAAHAAVPAGIGLGLE